MGWSLGFDSHWDRDIGYGVPAYCDHPGCGKVIDRGLAYVCGGEPYGGDRGCGLYLCGDHLAYHGARVRGKVKTVQLCARCGPRIKAPFTPTPDHPDWTAHKLKDPSWARWRKENPTEVAQLRAIKAAPVCTSAS